MTSELGRRIAFTLGALLVYRIGTYIPLPGFNASVWEQIFATHRGGALGLANAMSAGAVGRLSIFALGIVPFMTAAVLLQLTMFVSSRMRALRTGDDRARGRLVRYTYVLTVVLALMQGLGIGNGLVGVPGLVRDGNDLFVIQTAVTLAAGAVFVAWLAEQVTLRGIANGIAVILFTGVVLGLAPAVYGLLELNRAGFLSGGHIAIILVVAIAATVFVVFMELGRRRLMIQYAARQVGLTDRVAHLSLKLNNAGIVPALLASWIAAIPLLVVSVFGITPTGFWASWGNELQHGRPLFMVVYAVAIVLCTFIYTALVVDPSQAAETLGRYGGTIPGVAPGEATAEHIDDVLTRTTLLGAVYLAIICIVPELLISYLQVPFYFGGISLLVVVCTVLDIDTQVRSESAITVESGG